MKNIKFLGLLNLFILIATLIIFDSIKIKSDFLLGIIVILASLILWKAIRFINNFDESLEILKSILLMAIVLLSIYVVLYLFSGEVFGLIQISCTKKVICDFTTCPLIFDINETCQLVQQFLAANVRFTTIQIVYLIIGREFGSRILK